MVADGCRGFGFAFFQKREHNAFERRDEKGFPVYGPGLDQGSLYFENPAHIHAVHAMQAEMVRLNLQLF